MKLLRDRPRQLGAEALRPRSTTIALSEGRPWLWFQEATNCFQRKPEGINRLTHRVLASIARLSIRKFLVGSVFDSL